MLVEAVAGPRKQVVRTGILGRLDDLVRQYGPELNEALVPLVAIASDEKLPISKRIGRIDHLLYIYSGSSSRLCLTSYSAHLACGKLNDLEKQFEAIEGNILSLNIRDLLNQLPPEKLAGVDMQLLKDKILDTCVMTVQDFLWATNIELIGAGINDEELELMIEALQMKLKEHGYGFEINYPAKPLNPNGIVFMGQVSYIDPPK